MMEYVNLQRLAVIPYENSSWVIPKGKRGYWTWTSDMNCWSGTLDDCDSDDDLDGTEVVVCGSIMRATPSIVARFGLWRIMTQILGSNLVLGLAQTLRRPLVWLRSGRRMMCRKRSRSLQDLTLLSRLSFGRCSSLCLHDFNKPSLVLRSRYNKMAQLALQVEIC